MKIQNIGREINKMNVKTLYVIPTARYSIEQRNIPFAEKEYQRRMLDTVLSMTDDSPFRWTCASAAVVSDYLRSADDITRKTFYSAVEKVISKSAERAMILLVHVRYNSDKSVETLDSGDMEKTFRPQRDATRVGGVNSPFF